MSSLGGITLDCRDPERLAEFWVQMLDYRSIGTQEPYVVLLPKEGDRPHFVLQRVPEEKVGKNRMHVDVKVPELEPGIARAEGLGATRLDDVVHEDFGFRWVVMADPEGNEFCLGTSPD